MSFKSSSVLLLLSVALSGSSAFAQDKPFELGVEQRDFIPGQQQVQQYGKPMMIGVPKSAPPPPKKVAPPPKKINAGIQENQRPMQPPPQRMQQPQQMMTQAPQEGVLPPQFLGRWQVLGNRSAVEAQPQYQAGMDNIFSMTTSNVWNIQGSPEQGYMLSTDTGVSTPLMVQTQGNTAILRYQHPIRNTMAQEALVMQLGPNGAQFDGLERISIVKQGEPQPRAKVTYKLVGHRQ